MTRAVRPGVRVVAKREFTRELRVEPWPETGLAAEVAAGPDERRAVAARLGLDALDRLEAVGRVTRAGKGAFLLEATLRADVVQTCVVTLEPFASRLEERVRLVLRRPTGAEDVDLDPEAPDVVPLEGAAFDFGELVVEELALLLDPYPRAPDATLDALEASLADAAPGDDDERFAGLAARRRASAR